MGFSFIGEALLRSRLPDEPWRPIVAKLGYSFGFVMVVLGRQQLFTENTLTPVIPLLERRDKQTLYRVLRLWGVVRVMNLVGGAVRGRLHAAYAVGKCAGRSAAGGGFESRTGGVQIGKPLCAPCRISTTGTTLDSTRGTSKVNIYDPTRATINFEFCR